MEARRIDALHQLVDAIDLIFASTSITTPSYALFRKGQPYSFFTKVWCVASKGYMLSEFKDYYDLEKKLLACIVKFEIYDSATMQIVHIDNPYYGCRSLEEATIRKDFIPIEK